jgi:hypothetical protein
VGDQVPGLLGDPGPDRVSRYPGQVDHAAVQVDEEQHIKATERDRIDVAKSQLRVPAAWARKRSGHEGPEDRGAGPNR